MNNPNTNDKTNARVGAITILLLLILMIGGCVMCGDDKEENPAKPLTRKERIDKLFSDYDGSQYNVNKWITNNINDEESFKHINTTYIDLDTSILVTTTFSAKNAFGGVVKAICIADIDTSGNIKVAEIHN